MRTRDTRIILNHKIWKLIDWSDWRNHHICPSKRIIYQRFIVWFYWFVSSMSAKTASKCILGSISWMINSQRTFSTSNTWLCFGIASNLMARFTEMRRTEAKPESNRTAETTFEFDCFFSMGLALTHTDSCLFSNASSTD